MRWRRLRPMDAGEAAGLIILVVLAFALFGFGCAIWLIVSAL